MGSDGDATARANPEDAPVCIAHFAKPGGIRTSRELVEGLSALMGDLASGRITNGRANAICNAVGKILTTVKLEQQYGAKGGNGTTPKLTFVEGPPRGKLIQAEHNAADSLPHISTAQGGCEEGR